MEVEIQRVSWLHFEPIKGSIGELFSCNNFIRKKTGNESKKKTVRETGDQRKGKKGWNYWKFKRKERQRAFNREGTDAYTKRKKKCIKTKPRQALLRRCCSIYYFTFTACVRMWLPCYVCATVSKSIRANIKFCRIYTAGSTTSTTTSSNCESSQWQRYISASAFIQPSSIYITNLVILSGKIQWSAILRLHYVNTISHTISCNGYNQRKYWSKRVANNGVTSNPVQSDKGCC